MLMGDLALMKLPGSDLLERQQLVIKLPVVN